MYDIDMHPNHEDCVTKIQKLQSRTVNTNTRILPISQAGSRNSFREIVIARIAAVSTNQHPSYQTHVQDNRT